MQLNDGELFRSNCLIDGAWVAADNGARFVVTNPADGRIVAEVPDMGVAETKRAIAAAAAAFPLWKAKSAKERSAILRRWYDLMIQHRDDLALLMTTEQGKPLAEAQGEIGYGAAFVEWFSEEAKRVYGETIPGPSNDRRLIVIRQPVGVVAAITPWNFPMAMITRKCAPALAAGCTVVIKPAEDTPLSALALGVLAERAGMPKGVINIITGAPEVIGVELTANPTIRKLSFTGSTKVGKLLMRQSSDTMKRLSLELGGNAPFIVFDDADLDAAIKGAMTSKFRNTGQTCISANRLFVQGGIYEEFTARLAQAVSALKVGVGTEPGVHQGPLINTDAIEKVERLVEDAVGHGARVVMGGRRHPLGEQFYQPTILADVTAEMACTQEEIFGPVAALIRFESEEDVMALANGTPYGLAAYFYSQDIRRVWRVAEALEFGMVGINEGMISTEVAPFGGVKESGIGREGSHHGIDEFVEVKYLCLGGLS